MTFQKTNSAAYWRQSKFWPHLVGKRGKVIVSTYLRSADEAHQQLTPYSFALIELEEFGKSGGAVNKQKVELMGVGNEKLKTGDTIECVLRRCPKDDESDVIEYVIKAKKYEKE